MEFIQVHFLANAMRWHTKSTVVRQMPCGFGTGEAARTESDSRAIFFQLYGIKANKTGSIP